MINTNLYPPAAICTPPTLPENNVDGSVDMHAMIYYEIQMEKFKAFEEKRKLEAAKQSFKGEHIGAGTKVFLSLLCVADLTSKKDGLFYRVLSVFFSTFAMAMILPCNKFDSIFYPKPMDYPFDSSEVNGMEMDWLKKKSEALSKFI